MDFISSYHEVPKLHKHGKLFIRILLRLASSECSQLVGATRKWEHT